MTSVSLTPPLQRPLVVCVVLGLHAVALGLGWSAQPAGQTPALPALQVALIRAQPAAQLAAAATPAPRPVQARPRPPAAPPQTVPQTAALTRPIETPIAAPASNLSPAAAATPATTAVRPGADPGTTQLATAQITAARFDADYLNNPAPAYPPLSRRLGEAGQVMLKVRVSAAGLPAHIEFARSSGSDRLDRAARDAVARWRFVAARQGEHDIEAWVLVPIIFKLQEN